MIRLYPSKKFKSNYKKLSPELQQIAKQKIKLLAENPGYPSLKTGKLGGTEIFYSRVNDGIRMTWQYYKDGIILRNIGSHDKTLKNP